MSEKGAGVDEATRDSSPTDLQEIDDQPVTILEPVAHEPLPEECMDLLAHLYREHHDRLVKLAYLMTGSNAIAEELVQDAFVRAHGKLDRSRNPAAYLRTAVVNQCRSHLRRRSLERSKPVEPPRPEQPAEIDEMWDALSRISPKRRAALVLRFYEDLPINEIAAVLCCRPGTVKSMIHRGLRELRSEVAL